LSLFLLLGGVRKWDATEVLSEALSDDSGGSAMSTSMRSPSPARDLRQNLSWKEEKGREGLGLLCMVVRDGGQVVSAEDVGTGGNPLLAVAIVDVVIEATVLGDIGR
jgi:hypothetical protein